MASYGIPQCWAFLKVTDFQAIDSVQFCFLRRVLGVSKFARSRLVLLLTGVRLTTEALAQTFRLPITPNFQSYVESWEAKLADIDVGFLSNPAMLERGWAAPLSTGRSTLCRHAIHGFHHILCANGSFHEPDPSCTCRFCGLHCHSYHLQHCLLPPVASVLQLV
jgi:hypothetical protein